MRISLLLNKLKNWGKEPSEKELARAKEDMFVRVAKLKKLLASPEYKEFLRLLDQYIQRCQIQKLKYNFAHAYMIDDKKTFKHAAFLDNDIDFAQRLINMVPEVIADFEAAEKEEKEEESADA